MTGTLWAIAIVGGVGTLLERWSFLSVAHRTTALPPVVKEGLRMIPAAALAALVAPAVFRGGSADGSIDLLDPRLPAALAAVLVMWRTRNIVLTLLVGMGVLLGLDAVL